MVLDGLSLHGSRGGPWRASCLLGRFNRYHVDPDCVWDYIHLSATTERGGATSVAEGSRFLVHVASPN